MQLGNTTIEKTLKYNATRSNKLSFREIKRIITAINTKKSIFSSSTHIVFLSVI